eukprot:CAMPEP_0178984796 /NCGR_PEP_ID=MMETSP0795-20121207/1809_1 /TAXON_ID=88552 /ORGANISM="Amoebophrya sp., Strain Ameob2" /LENGTH=396 /DNA_ID=CAMNT_0020675709 /DNA_START=48 /DNA_END=1236 /DNA_ORIENTATION=+
MTAQARARSARFLPFHQARDYARSSALMEEWLQWCARGNRPPAIPSHPAQFYGRRGLWHSFPDWLGYAPKRKPASKQNVFWRGGRLRLHSSNAKLDLASRISPSFEVQSLPHRSTVQLVYRCKGAEKWCPLVLRFGHKLRADQAIHVRLSKHRDGLGLAYLELPSGRVFFFTYAFLDDRLHPTTQQPGGEIVRVNRRDAVAHAEIKDDDQLLDLLSRHKDESTLLKEEDFGTRLFCHPADACSQTLTRKATQFLQEECGLDISRPTSGCFDSHLVVQGTKSIIVRCCVGSHFYARIDIGMHGGTNKDGHQARRCTAELCPDFLLGVVGDTDISSDHTQNPRLLGVYVFPREYLQRSGAIYFNARQTGKSALTVIHPWMAPKQPGAIKRQAEQADFF